MTVFGQRHGGHVGDVVGVDEGFGDVAGRQDDLAFGIQQLVLAEVSGEPGAADQTCSQTLRSMAVAMLGGI